MAVIVFSMSLEDIMVVKKKVVKKKESQTSNTGLKKLLTLSKELAAVIGKDPLPRTEVVKKIWIYIKKHDLQNPKNKRNILADQKLKAIFNKKEITMFELPKILTKHLKSEV